MMELKDESSFYSEKLISVKEAAHIISKLKKKGKTAGLCHGGFDLLHPGHMRHFESAKNLCDVLIVSITSDKFVSLRKNTGRPIFSETLRAYAAASISYVDYVFVSNHKKATEVIINIKPSYYIKGPDYLHKMTPGIISERDAVKSVGGMIKYTDDATLSTTEIINYIKNNIKRDKILLLIDRDGTLIKDTQFIGKEDNWIKELSFNEPVIQLLSYIQTKENTTNIVLTNQAGVARGYFDENRVNEINLYIDNNLKKNGVIIHNWQYCADVDADYANHSSIYFKPEYIKERTRRKPSHDMVNDALHQLHTDIDAFDKVIVIGDRHEDKGLADNINAQFIDVSNKKYDELIKEYEIKRKS